MTEMTIGELSRRTGLSNKAIREYEARGLIYSSGRSPGNYRLFDDSAVWCARVIRRLLGLTVKEFTDLAAVYLSRPDKPIGLRLAALLKRVEQRIDERIAELEGIREGIRASAATARTRSPAPPITGGDDGRGRLARR